MATIDGGFMTGDCVCDDVTLCCYHAEMADKLNNAQPKPIKNDHPAVWPLVMADMSTRDEEGRKKYGVPLQPHNGRDVLIDAYQEALDLAVYLRQAIYERDGK